MLICEVSGNNVMQSPTVCRSAHYVALLKAMASVGVCVECQSVCEISGNDYFSFGPHSKTVGRSTNTSP